MLVISEKREQPMNHFFSRRKKVVTLCLAALLALSFCLPPMTVYGASSEDINRPELYFNQKPGSRTCTLCSVTMLLRRLDMLNGSQDWQSITEEAVKPVAWNNGLSNNFWYKEYHVINKQLAASPSNREQLLALLERHPEGVVIYDRATPHAILLTDYTDGVFYCADPSSGNKAGRMPISGAYRVTIENADSYWYVAGTAASAGSSAQPAAQLTASHTKPAPAYAPDPSQYQVAYSRQLSYRSGNLMRGDDVMYMQACLSYLGYDVDVDGVFGAGTDSVLCYFQEDYGLTADGVCGSATWAAFEKAVADNPAPQTLSVTATINKTSFDLGEKLTLTAKATGKNLTYQWYYKKKDMTGWSAWVNHNTAVTSGEAKEAWDGMLVYCKVTDESGNTANSNSVKINVAPVLRILAQPSDIVTSAGNAAAFSVKAQGSGLTYQWYYRKAGVSEWSVWSGHTSESVTAVANASWDGMQVKCRVTDANGNRLDSVAVTVAFSVPFEILRQPQSHTIAKGSRITLSVVASGSGLTYQWYYKKKSMTSFVKWEDRTHSSETVTPNDAWDGIRLYCHITDANGASVNSDTVTVNFVSELKITSQPQSVTIARCGSLKIAVGASGTGLTYQWYFKKKGQTDFTKWEGRTRSSETIITNDTWNGIKLYCLVTDCTGASVRSDAATVTFAEPIVITTQPRNVTVVKGSDVTLSVKATGVGLKYQWYYKKKGQSSFNIWSGRINASETATTNDTWDGIQFYCMIRDSVGTSLRSDTAIVNLVEKLKITSQPQSATVSKGDEVTLSVKASGGGLTYQWYFKKKGQTDFTKWEGRNHASETVTPNDTWDGITLYCVVGDSTGASVKSDTAVISFISKVKITAQPQNKMIAKCGTVTVSVKASGSGLTYQWYYKKKDQASFNKWNGHTHAAETVVTNDTWDGMQLYCVVSDSTGASAISDIATVTFAPPIEITSQPTSQTVAKGSQVTLAVKATGSGLTYEWYYKKVGQTAYSKWIGHTKASETGNPDNSWNGIQFYCLVTDCTDTSVRSDTVTISFK